MKTCGNFLVIAWMLWPHCFLAAVEGGERLKRELRFPKGGSFAAAVALASFLPKGPTDGLAHVLEFDLGFPFPEKFVFGEKVVQKKRWQHPARISTANRYKFHRKSTKRSRKKRSQKEDMNLLLKIEDVITRIGFNGSACASRFQCELKHISPKNSLLEELLFALFKPFFKNGNEKCEVHQEACPVSLLHVIMHSEQISAPQMI